LFEDAIQSAGRQIIAEFPGYCNATTFDRVFKLTMTAASGDKKPTVSPNNSQNIAYFHCARIANYRPVAKNA